LKREKEKGWGVLLFREKDKGGKGKKGTRNDSLICPQ